MKVIIKLLLLTVLLNNCAEKKATPQHKLITLNPKQKLLFLL